MSISEGVLMMSQIRYASFNLLPSLYERVHKKLNYRRVDYWGLAVSFKGGRRQKSKKTNIIDSFFPSLLGKLTFILFNI